jgi:small-conductance mechanosensitive channel
MRLLKQLVPVAVVAFAGAQAMAAVQGNMLLTLVLGIATAVLALFVYVWVVRWSERRTPAELAAKGATGAVGRGLLIGVAMFGAVIANIAFMDGYRVDGLGSVTGAIALLGFTAAQ